MKNIDLYIIRQFSWILIMSLITFLVLFVIMDLVENLDRFIDADAPVRVIGMYYLYSCPWFVKIGLPMAVLISTVSATGLLARRNELTAMKASGISLYRIATPLIASAIIISIASFFFDDQVVAKGNKKRHLIEQEHVIRSSKKPYRARKRNIFLQKSESFHIAIDRYEAKQNKATGVALQFLQDGQLVKRIDANWMAWDEEKKAWTAHTFAVREFHPDGFESKVHFSRGDTLLSVNFGPMDISREAISPEEKNYSQLKIFIEELADSGIDTTRWEVNLQAKISFAFTNLIVVLFSFPLVATRRKSGLAFGAGMSLFVILGYTAFIRFGQTLGYKGILEPVLAAWLGNLVFSFGGILLLLSARK
ncbi:MAG: LptF/LptG family permease [Candidatus Neomarinimicrobiota bacterium]